MADANAALSELDQLQQQLNKALTDEDWAALSDLNARVKPTVEPIMLALEQGLLKPSAVQARLETLNDFVQMANSAALAAREAAQDSLKGVNKNRSAARAYQNVSSGKPK
ncbi:MAG: SOS cell division inhibitor [Pseudomonadota bacterium]|nr:SOS cell division inhibitor [Pseudomonadota bacterium]